jgi:3-mercaptopyruvate sulfurtransferase SseA
VLRWLARVKGDRLAAAPVPAGPAPVPSLVSTSWLAEQADPDLAVVQVGRRDDPPPAGSLPGAARLDWIEDLQHPGRRGVADGGEFAAVAGRLGIGRETHVVLAGERRPQLAASAYWSFAYHGHMRLSILDGGLPRWTAEGREVTAAATGRRCYFGAWSEYGSLTDVPIAQRTGAPSTDETNAEPA